MLSHESEAVCRELFFAFKEWPPDFGGRRQAGERLAEGLDGQPSVVTDCGKRSEGLLPADLPL